MKGFDWSTMFLIPVYINKAYSEKKNDRCLYQLLTFEKNNKVT